MLINKEHLIKFIQECTHITVNIAHSGPGDIDENIDYDFPLNEFVLRQDGTLELWFNTGYEI